MRGSWLLMALLPLVMTSASVAAEITSTRGVLVFWGNVFTPPIHLELTATGFSVNGMRRYIDPTAAPLTLQKPKLERVAPEYELTKSVFEAAAADRAKGMSDAQVVERARTTLAASPLVESVAPMGCNYLQVMWKGARAGTGELLGLSQCPVPSVEDNSKSYLAGIMESLQNGALVIVGAGYAAHVPPGRVGWALSQLREIRSGWRGDLDMFPPSVVETLRHPSKLERASK